MADTTFSSGMARHMASFVELKHAQGWPYGGSTRSLVHFDRMACESYPTEASITAAMFESWIALNADVHPNTLLRKVTPIRQFSKYLNDIGVNSYIPSGKIPLKQVNELALRFRQVCLVDPDITHKNNVILDAVERREQLAHPVRDRRYTSSIFPGHQRYAGVGEYLDEEVRPCR